MKENKVNKSVKSVFEIVRYQKMENSLYGKGKEHNKKNVTFECFGASYAPKR